MEIKLEQLNRPGDLTNIEDMLVSRMTEANSFEVNMENIKNISLASFNALVRLYMTFSRKGRPVTFFHCHGSRIQELIHKTNFDHVFITD